MNERNKKLIGKGMVLGKKILSVAETILLELIEQMEDMEYMRFHTYSCMGCDVREMRYDSEAAAEARKRRARQQAIRRLKQNELIKLKKEGDRVIYVLTNDGKIKAIKSIIRLSDDYFNDGRICLVSFDFPEVANGARVEFRRFLKSVGFGFVQGSVWSIGKDVAKPISALVDLLKIRQWVVVYVAQK